ncbi:MAG: DUF2341 domain-containing protein [Deltaproteobacteria bacterium]|nr:DUF2341 domain-containing protein [Deltaproteobacteria bacterium]
MIVSILSFMLFFSANQQVWFDFEGNREFQTGGYVTSTNCMTGDGSAILTESSDWAANGWSHRLEIIIQNDTGQALINYPVQIDLKEVPPELFDIARVDGNDLRLYTQSGSLIPNYWLEYYDFITKKGFFWFRLPSLPAGNTSVHLYFGNSEAAPIGSWQDIFTWSNPVEGAFLSWPSPITGAIIPFVDNTSFVAGDATPVNLPSNQVTSINVEQGAISSTGPYSFGAAPDTFDIPLPYSMAGTTFVFPGHRYDDSFEFYSPLGVANVSISSNTTIDYNFQVSDASALTLDFNIPEESYKIESDLPIVVFHRTESGDGYPLVPASTELWGGATGSVHVAALNDNTSVTAYYSDGSSQNITVNSNTYVTLNRSGNQGDGPAIHLTADGPIGAISSGDGDGGDAVTFYPSELLSQEFIFPRNGEYLFISTREPYTHCEILSQDGTTVLTTALSTAYAPPHPDIIYLTSYLQAGNRLSCTKPVVAYFEDQITDDERHLLSVKDHRPLAWPPLNYGVTNYAVQSHFQQGPGWVETPNYELPYLFTSWDDIVFYEPTSMPENTSIGYLVSQNNGFNWMYFDGEQWMPAPDSSYANSSLWLQYAFEFLPPSPQLKLKIILEGDGQKTPVQGPISFNYDYQEGAGQFVIEPIESPQYQGQAFTINIEAQDEDGRLLTGFESRVILSLNNANPISPSLSPEFIRGKTSFRVVIVDPGEEVEIIITDGTTSARSNSFDVNQLDISRLIIATGDQQWGLKNEPLPNPLVVQVLNENDRPVAYQKVLFTKDEGAGYFDDNKTEMEVVTDFDGFAQVDFTPSLGINTVRAEVEGLEPVQFLIRGVDGQLVDRKDAIGSNGCNTNSGNSSSGTLPIVLLLFALALPNLLKLRH